MLSDEIEYGYNGKPYYLDKDLTPLSRRAWGERYSDQAYKRIDATSIGAYWVSTVWLGLDHQLWPDGPPLIFETMVFEHDDIGRDLDMRRYTYEWQARLGHAEICAGLRFGRELLPAPVAEISQNNA